uniref:RING-type domain-containing protein n=1 Tax=Kalanchoe fedtschenkoi TaxID=63787 RepID=A0A7N0T7E6_KALFE
MVGSSPDHHHFLLEPPLSPDPSSVPCSICLDAVLNDAQRSFAKLKCGHQFHLDCIGSAFNIKGAMQCPNCRTVEKGRWLYTNEAAHALPEYNVDDWIPDQEQYELAFPEMPLGVHWCPFSGLARYRSMLEDVDAPSAMYQGLPEQALFAEHTAASTVSHSYITYIGQPPPSNATDSLEQPLFNHHWNVITHGDVPITHGFPVMDFQYQRWIHRRLPISGQIDGGDQVSNPTSVTMRHVRDEPVTRSTSSTHTLLLGQGSGSRAFGPFLPSVVPPPPGRTHERILYVPPPPVFQQSGSAPAIPPMQRNRRYYFDQRPSVVPTQPTHPDQNRAYYVMHPQAGQSHREVLHPVPSHMHPWDCFPVSSLDNVDLNWPPLHQATGHSEAGNNRSGSVWQRHWS